MATAGRPHGGSLCARRGGSAVSVLDEPGGKASLTGAGHPHNGAPYARARPFGCLRLWNRPRGKASQAGAACPRSGLADRALHALELGDEPPAELGLGAGAELGDGRPRLAQLDLGLRQGGDDVTELLGQSRRLAARAGKRRLEFLE
jgi:hypothetical protein